MSRATKPVQDPLARYRQLPEVPNDLHNDQRIVTDADFFDGLATECAAIAPVLVMWSRGDAEAAKRAIVEHFRTRRKPVISKYRTDPHWSDWGAMTVTKRADLLCRNRIVQNETDILDADGGSAEHGGINFDVALIESHLIRRQGATATLAQAWSLTNAPAKKRAYAAALERWFRGYIAADPFVLVDGFHREEFNGFGGPAHNQLGTCYTLFAWAAVLDSELYRTPGALSEEFAFFFLKQFWFRAFQMTRLIGASWRADNHHLMERGTACYFIGVQFPEFKRAAELEGYSREIIIKHFDHNVLPDNVGAEHCTAYNYRCLIRYAMPESVARANGLSLLGKRRQAKLVDWLEHHAYITTPDGRLVETGDGDAPTLHHIAEQTGAMMGSTAIKGVLASLNKDALVNPEYQSRWDATEPRIPDGMARIYPYGGHITMRDGWTPDAMFLHMAIKNGSLYNIHAHWNMFEFTFAANGKRLIGNPTARTYGLPQGVTRGFYFSMDAHNTLIIDDDNLKSHRALATHWGYQPTRIATAHTCLNADDRFDYATFTHDGYYPLIHRRDVLFVRGRYAIMTDGVTMNFAGLNSVFDSVGDIRPHLYRQRINFESDVAATSGPTPDSVVAKDTRSPAGVLVIPEPFENLRTDIGPNEYLAALNHPRFQGYMAADILRETIGACMFSTVYYPFTGRAPRVTVTSLTPQTLPFRDDHYHAIAIDDGRQTDIWFVQRDRQRLAKRMVQAGSMWMETDAACVYLAIRNGEVIDGFRVGGRRVSVNGSDLALPAHRLTRHVDRQADPQQR